MNKKVEDALKALAAGLQETPDDAAEAVKSIRGSLNDEIYTPIFGAGVTKGKREGASTPELKDKLAKLAELETENEQLKSQAEELGKGTATVEQLKAQHKLDLAAAKKAGDEKVKEKDGQIKQKVRELAAATLRGEYAGKVDDLLVDPLVEKAMKNAEVHDDLTVELYDEKKTSIGLVDDVTARQAVVKNGLKGVDPKFVKVAPAAPADKGQNLGGFGSGGTDEKKVVEGVDLNAFQNARAARANPLLPQVQPSGGGAGAKTG